VDLDSYRNLALTYPEAGATASAMPAGYRHLAVRRRLGSGRELFDRAADKAMRFGMQRGVGLNIHSTSQRAEPGTVVVLRRGPVQAACRVVYVVDEPDRRGFAYGTLPQHPAIGEELFLVEYDSDTTEVHGSVVSFSKPGSTAMKALGPIMPLAQKLAALLYLRALRR
jgi:uncharacterized protein (UPF0548 family)